MKCTATVIQRRGVMNLAFWICLTVFSATGQLRAESDDDALPAMRSEIQQLRQELSVLKEELRRLEQRVASQNVGTVSGMQAGSQAPPVTAAESSRPQESSSDQQVVSIEEAVPLLQSQVAEQAQTKVESNSKMPVRIFGTVLSTTFFNSGKANWLDNPTTASAPAGAATGTISSSLRQTRLGAIVEGPRIGSLRASGFVAADFFGGSPAFQTSPLFGLPRLVYGYVRLEGSRTALEAGQDQMILAPRNPTSVAAFALPDLYQAGNLYMRAPQLRVERQLVNSDQGEVELTVGMVAPVGGYPTSDSGAPASDRWARPAAQARIVWRAPSRLQEKDIGWELGLSGHYGRARYATETASSWAEAFDFDAHRGRLGLAGEGFIGQNIEALGGSIGQPAKSLGGYLEGRLRATRRLQFNAGFGTDQITRQYVSAVPLKKNSGLYANSIFQFTPEFTTSFEYRWLASTPFTGTVKHNNHLDLAFAYSF